MCPITGENSMPALLLPTLQRWAACLRQACAWATPNRNGGNGRILAALFLCFALPTGLFLATVTPPGRVADEAAHAARIVGLSELDLIGHRDGPTHSAGMTENPTLPMVGMLNHLPDLTMTRSEYTRLNALGWGAAPGYMQISPIAVYAPVAYIPATLGLLVAKLAHMKPLEAFLAARLGSLLAYLGLGCAALLIACRGQGLIFCTLAMPMGLSLGASLSEDGVLIGATALGMALLTRAAAQQCRAAYWWSCVLLGAVVLVKPPYFPLLAVLLLPLPATGLWRHLLRQLLVVALVMLPALLWTVATQALVAMPVDLPPYQAGPLWPGPPTIFNSTDPGAQMHVLLSDPKQFILLPLHSLAEHLSLLFGMVGLLGWLNLPLPRDLRHAWEWALLAAVLYDLCRRQTLPETTKLIADERRWLPALLLGAAGFACFLGVYLSQYLTWTMVGQDTIDGPQGRYLLPVLPLLGVALPRLLPPAPVLRAAAIGTFGVACLATLLMLPRALAYAFYLH
jgi:hypothetical protein